MNPFAPVERIATEIFTRLPEKYNNPKRSEWADANKFGAELGSFLEGPSFDGTGNLYVTDIPFGRIFRVSPSGEWTLVCEYDGWPNGLKIRRDGRIFVADRRNGIMELDPATNRITPLLRSYRSENFRGINDLTIAANGDIYFTDQGQSGWQDASGRVFRWRTSGDLDTLIDTVPSPNGLVLDATGRTLFLAVTRANAVWRIPVPDHGMCSKAGTWIQFSGGNGPDGLALDAENGLVVAHPGSGVWRFDRHGFATHFAGEIGYWGTNVAFGGQGMRTVYATESESASIIRFPAPFAGWLPSV